MRRNEHRRTHRGPHAGSGPHGNAGPHGIAGLLGHFGRGTPAVLLLLFLGQPLLHAAPQLTVTAERRAGRIVAALAFHGETSSELVTSLLEGLESRIVFSARLYEKRVGLMAIRGDRLLGQTSIVRRAYRDILTQQFVVAEEGGLIRAYETPTALVAAFLTVPALSFPLPAKAGKVYVAARAVLEPVLLMPPLTLVTLLGTAEASATPWARSDVP